MRYDVVVATLNRPQALKTCLNHLEMQTETPERVIIVDASDDHDFVRTSVMTGRRSDIQWHFLQAEQRSVVSQRNQGLDLVRREVVFMPDDDSVLYPQSAAEMLSVYRADETGQIGGVSGIAAGRSPLSVERTAKTRARAVKDSLDPWRNVLEDRLVPKPFETYPRSLWSERSIPDWIDGERFALVPTIGGYLMSLRTSAVRENPFDENLGYGIGYALHEDMELSLRLQREGYLLVAARQAPIFHDVHPSQRAGGFNYGFCWIANYLYACRRNLPETSGSWKDDLPRFLAYKVGLYRLRAVMRWDAYAREVFQGAQVAWRNRRTLMDAAPADLGMRYRELCDRYVVTSS